MQKLVENHSKLQNTEIQFFVEFKLVFFKKLYYEKLVKWFLRLTTNVKMLNKKRPEFESRLQHSTRSSVK